MQCYNCNSKRLVYDKNRDAYVCLDCKYVFPKQYFFISHSHLDIEKVRIVRNIIEETFFYEPILFFLKCLSEDNEIIDLIRREINERIWFIYCKSENSEKSKYVRAEREYIDYLIKKGFNKKVLNINLDGFEIWDEECYNNIRSQVAFQIRKTKIFLSYTRADKPFYGPIFEALSEHGFRVWGEDNGLMDAGEWFEHVGGKIKEHAYKDGIFMPILSDSAGCTEYMRRELAAAVNNGAFILPVIVKSCGKTADIAQRLPAETAAYLNSVKQFIFDADSPAESAKELVGFINAF